jgi:PilZ domain
MARSENASIPKTKRKHPRFPLNYPVQLKFSADGDTELEAMSNNISLGGILLQAAWPAPQNRDVEFVMTVPRTPRPIRLKGAGRVVRIEQHSSGRGFGIAIECKRPIHRILNRMRPFLA